MHTPVSCINNASIAILSLPSLRYSFLGAMSAMEIIVTQNKVTVSQDQEPMQVWKLCERMRKP